MQRRRKQVIVAAAVTLVVIGLAALAAFLLGGLSLDSARPPLPGTALAEFRLADAHPADGDGVYTYRTSGGESIDALGGSHHRYPAETTIALVHVACGVRLRWDVLAGRSSTWTLCLTKDGLTVRRLDQLHTFFGRRDVTDYTCTPRGAAFTCHAKNAAATGRVSVLAPATVEVDGTAVTTLHVRTTASVTGGSHGTEIVEWWIDPARGLPLRVAVTSRTSREELIVGTVHYREDATLSLVSTSPQR